MHLHDLDAEEGFKGAVQTASDYATRNFLVDFDIERATCTSNIDADQILSRTLTKDPGKALGTRWLNVWSSTIEERISVRTVLTSYGVSKRLSHLICPEVSSNASKTRFTASRDPSCQNKATLSIDALTKDLWHFCSVDWGRKYCCISYNALFNTSNFGSRPGSRLPEVTRVWSSMVLCDDGTVISVFETPEGMSPAEVKVIRCNQINVLKNLSHQYKHDPSQLERNIFQADIRPCKDMMLEASPGINDHFETASRLFYYIFDDWRATFELVSGRQHPYREKLDDIRDNMARAPAVGDVEKLHRIGQQLGTLQRVYQGYEKIVDRLLQRQRQLSSPWYTGHPVHPDPWVQHRQQAKGRPGETANDTQLPQEAESWITEAQDIQATIKLPLSTIARFERLMDRVRLYALTEIEECLAEKESLVLMTFNLVNLKNAEAIERLTRTTILLAKVTIMFLPVSLMTGYFGISVKAIPQLYSLETYWVCFVVIGVLTTIMLLVFSLANNKVTGKIAYESLTRNFFQMAKRRSTRKDRGETKEVLV